MTQSRRTKEDCRCFGCRNLEEDIAEGRANGIYGDTCSNCGFYAPLSGDGAEGMCCKFELLKHPQGMGLFHRKDGVVRENGSTLIVGGAFGCIHFRPLHTVPGPDDPERKFYAPLEEGSRT